MHIKKWIRENYPFREKKDVERHYQYVLTKIKKIKDPYRKKIWKGFLEKEMNNE